MGERAGGVKPIAVRRAMRILWRETGCVVETCDLD